VPDHAGLRVRSVSAVSQPFLGQTRNFIHLSRNGSETAEERLEKRPSFGQGHGKRFSYMWLPIVGSFIAIKAGGGENEQLA
jgi:hypothetical protein